MPGQRRRRSRHGPKCFHGKEAKFTSPLEATLPNEAIISVAYNTTDYGASPVGPAACTQILALALRV